ncbi:MAG: hypothetical protein DHS20C05_07600 [Hyphococcus sp.]|nr:MAG: hypothetical protein DHS20C05_07600 [Marinicaulis sp.]
MMRQISYRPIEERDVSVLYGLMCDLADNEKERFELTVTPQRLIETGFTDQPLWRGFLAEAKNKAVGYATYTEDFHIWSGVPRICLDDIYVHPDFRSHGIGEALMQLIFEQAKKTNAFVSWAVQPGNTRAIKFYEGLGAKYYVGGKCSWRPSN